MTSNLYVPTGGVPGTAAQQQQSSDDIEELSESYECADGEEHDSTENEDADYEESSENEEDPDNEEHDSSSERADSEEHDSSSEDDEGADNEELNIAESEEVYRRISPPTSPEFDYAAYPLGEFHNFEEDGSIEKIKLGQIWATYSTIDHYPKIYVKVMSVEASKIKYSSTTFLPRSNEADWGLDFGCGRFQVEPLIEEFELIFSHMMNAVPVGNENDKYDIYPQSGEVWALYKDWSIHWTHVNLDGCYYYVVEILEHTGDRVRVSILTKVEGHSAVFVQKVPQTLEVAADERFAYRIPAFRLPDSDSSKGKWELHSVSVPRRIFNEKNNA